jgi:hypothetical protein
MIMIAMNCQGQFRQMICLRDKNCLVTGLCEYECDAAHLIPYKICEKYAPQFIFDSRNGIFLCKNLHACFDKYLWTFDLYDVIYNPVKGRYYCRVIVYDNHKNMTINQYKDQYVEIPIQIWPFLYVQYQVFIAIHYEAQPPHDIESIYREILQTDPIFNYLHQHEIPLDAHLSKGMHGFLQSQGLITTQECDVFFVNTILKHRSTNEGDSYLVWWDHLPISMSTWEWESQLNRTTLDEYYTRIEQRMDENYTLKNK